MTLEARGAAVRPKIIDEVIDVMLAGMPGGTVKDALDYLVTHHRACPECGEVLSDKQKQRGGKYCSRRCARRGMCRKQMCISERWQLPYKPHTVEHIQRVVDQELVVCWNCHHWERRENLCENDLCEVCYGERY